MITLTKKIFISWSLMTLLLQGTQAFALIDAQAYVGRKWYQFEVDGSPKRGVGATVVEFAGHIDPIPLIPLAVGLFASSISPSADDLRASSASFMQVGLDVHAWIPLIPILTPYVRVKYPFLGDLKVSGQALGGGNTAETTYKLTGAQVDVGAKFSFLPLVKILVQAGRSMDTIEISEYKVNGAKQTTTASGKAPANSVLVGVEIGI